MFCPRTTRKVWHAHAISWPQKMRFWQKNILNFPSTNHLKRGTSTMFFFGGEVGIENVLLCISCNYNSPIPKGFQGTLQWTNIAGWKMGAPDWVDAFPIENGEFPASYVIVYQVWYIFWYILNTYFSHIFAYKYVTPNGSNEPSWQYAENNICL